MTLLEINNEEIKFRVGEIIFTATYELEFSHSEGERTIDPQRDTYFEYYELEFNDELLVDINGTEKYQKWAPSERIYNTIKGWVKNYHYHYEII